jgi:ubiquinone/menaquinone biosynthesis C-methylase UbiE
MTGTIVRFARRDLLRGFVGWALTTMICYFSIGDARPTFAQETTKTAEPRTKTRRYPPGTYMGRPIAQVMGYQGAEWLFRDTREAEEQPEQMLDALKIKPGETVADIGAGAGYTSLRLSKRVGPTGRVLATDVQPQMLTMLKENAKAVGARNIEAIRSTQTDTKLPEGSVDLALMVDVYHEASDPEALLQGLKKALKPGGRLVLVEFRGEDPEVPIKPEHKMTLVQVRKEVEPQGFRFKESFEFLPWQHIIVFEKPAEEPKPTEAEKKAND